MSIIIWTTVFVELLTISKMIIRIVNWSDVDVISSAASQYLEFPTFDEHFAPEYNWSKWFSAWSALRVRVKQLKKNSLKRNVGADLSIWIKNENWTMTKDEMNGIGKIETKIAIWCIQSMKPQIYYMIYDVCSTYVCFMYIVLACTHIDIFNGSQRKWIMS